MRARPGPRTTPRRPGRPGRGLATLWDPGLLLLLGGPWGVAFLYTGRGQVTGAVLHFRVHRSRI